MLTEKMLHGRAKTSAKGKMDTSQGSTLHQSISCSQNSPPPNFFFSIVPLVVPYPILYLTLRSSSSLTVQNLHRRSKFTQITGRLGELFSEKTRVYNLKADWIHWIHVCTKDIVISFFVLCCLKLLNTLKFDARRLDAIQKEAFLEGMLASLVGGMSNVPAMPRASTHGFAEDFFTGGELPWGSTSTSWILGRGTKIRCRQPPPKWKLFPRRSETRWEPWVWSEAQ